MLIPTQHQDWDDEKTVIAGNLSSTRSNTKEETTLKETQSSEGGDEPTSEEGPMLSSEDGEVLASEGREVSASEGGLKRNNTRRKW